MHKYTFICDIGNTDTKICLYKNYKIVSFMRLKTININKLYLEKKLNVLKKYHTLLSFALISSVVPNVFKYFKIYFKKSNIKCFELKDINTNDK